MPTSFVEHLVAVRPASGGWCVECDFVGPAAMFLSGQKAEAYGRRLATLLGERGYDARLIVHDQRDAIVATAQYFGATAPLVAAAGIKPDLAWYFASAANADGPVGSDVVRLAERSETEAEDLSP